MDRIGNAELWFGSVLEKANLYISVNPVAELLKATPANVERVIAEIDEKSGIIEKEEGNSRIYTEEMLRGLLKAL